MKRMFLPILASLLALSLLAGCSVPAARDTAQIYEATYLDLFDTVTVVKGYAENEAAFQEAARFVHDELSCYHRLFDIYNDYEGINNLKTVNDMAGISPVEVEDAVIDLLEDCRDYYDLTDGRVNVAMGSVLKLWHEARNAGLEDPANAGLPDMAELEMAAEHRSFHSIVIDKAAGTVYISDPQVRLDVGAVAKGWAAQRVAERMPSNMLLSLGGNICATGPKLEDGTPWVIGIQNPEGGAYLHTLNVSGGSFVTSGDYQRTYTVAGKDYHHIIDPDTLMPAVFWRSVTVICDDSGLADALSTALFVLPLEAGQKLLEQTGAMAIWVDGQGKAYYSPGVEGIIRS